MGLGVNKGLCRCWAWYIQTERGAPSWHPSPRVTVQSRRPSKPASSASPHSFPLTSQLILGWVEYG
jgi:hypothetical protein